MFTFFKVPEIKEAVDTGLLSMSKARRLSPVIEKENVQEWIAKAIELPERELEKEVAQMNPEGQS